MGEESEGMETAFAANRDIIGQCLRGELDVSWIVEMQRGRTKCRNAVYDQRTLFVATRSPACLRSIPIIDRKKSLISSQSALAATQPGPLTVMHRITNVGRWSKATQYRCVENRRAMSCSNRIRRILAMVRSSLDTADMAWVILRSTWIFGFR